MTRGTRELDIVLFGATGFVGRLTAQHLAGEALPGLRIALAGRSLTRLQDLARDLGPAAAHWPLLTVDASDEDAVGDLARRTRVVVTTVGPYLKYGVPLAAACAAAGTHYCDLTGEVLFIHRSIAANHDTARRTGARIVHACGFDSVPSDLGVFLTAEAARADGADLDRTHLVVRSLRGGVSGGTIDTARTEADELKGDEEAHRIVRDPWALVDGGRPASLPEPGETGAGRGDATASPRGGIGGILQVVRKAAPVRRDPDDGHFTGPFFMAGFNTRVVARSASLLGYGPRFRHVEYTDYGAGPAAAVTAAVATLGLGGVRAGLGFAPTRALLDRVLPKPGEGPSEQRMASGRFRMEVFGEASSGARYRTVVAAPYDPGYSGTAVMLGQAALALVEDADRLPEAAGVLTPATAIGMPLVERLRNHGFTLETERLPG